MENAIEWTAPDSDNTKKSGEWYAAVIAAGLIVSVVLYLITHDFVTAAIVVICAIALTVVGSRKPKDIEYSLDQTGVHIGDHAHHYGEFRSFAIDYSASQPSVVLMPLRRFYLGATIYFPEEQAEEIINLLSSIMPMEDHQADGFERLLHWIGL